MADAHYEFEEDYTVDSYDDCFDDIPEPLYGFRVRVMLKENEYCELESTCIVKSNRTSTRADDRQTGEEFASDAPPDCRLNVSG